MLLKLRAALGAFKLNRWGGGYIVVAGDFLSKDRYGAPTAAERQLGYCAAIQGFVPCGEPDYSNHGHRHAAAERTDQHLRLLWQ